MEKRKKSAPCSSLVNVVFLDPRVESQHARVLLPQRLDVDLFLVTLGTDVLAAAASSVSTSTHLVSTARVVHQHRGNRRKMWGGDQNVP